MIDYPPILQGSPYMQLESLRNYLVRLAEEVRAAGMSAERTAAALEGETVSGLKKQTERALADRVTALQSVIKKTAGVIESHVETLETSLQSDYVAQSEFGTYREQAQAQLTAAAAGVTELYTLSTQTGNALSELKTQLEGEIRRGVIRDPDTGQDVIGIAVSQKLYFQENGVPYIDPAGEAWFRLSPSQTFALYTSSGWQYWINGRKAGWFASGDSSLHLTQVLVESSARFGGDWLLETDREGFGLRYIG